MNLFHSRDDELITQFLLGITNPLRQEFPEAVKQALTGLQSGQPPESAGKILLAAMQEKIEEYRSDSVLSQDRVQSIKNKVSELENKLTQMDRYIANIEKEKLVVIKELEARDKQISEMMETIFHQNKLIARLHHKHQSLVRNLPREEAGDDEIN